MPRPRPPKKNTPRPHKGKRPPDTAQAEGVWIYGRHAALAALSNPQRRISRGLATVNGAAFLAEHGQKATLEESDAKQIARSLPTGAVHQGVAVLCDALTPPPLEDLIAPAEPGALFLMADQIEDPQNFGALLRSAEAFGARAVIGQRRHSPPESGALAKAAAGALERVPLCRETNLTRALEQLRSAGYFCAGLAGESENDISDMPKDQPVVLVCGAEGAGLRRLTRETCDGLYRIPIADSLESLNASNAAAIALYELRRGR